MDAACVLYSACSDYTMSILITILLCIVIYSACMSYCTVGPVCLFMYRSTDAPIEVADHVCYATVVSMDTLYSVCVAVVLHCIVRVQ